MAKPTPGSNYTTQTGDTLSSVSSKAYGDPARSFLIREANLYQIKTGSVETLPPGVKIFIPADNDIDILRKTQLNNGLK